MSLVAAGMVVGGVLAGTLGASAATGASTGTSAEAPATGYGYGGPDGFGGGRPDGDAHSSTPVRSDEKPVSAALAAQLTTKALAAVPGGKVYRVETDADGATYEAHMTKADGSEVTVKFDKNLKVTAIQSGMGSGGPRMGDHDGDGPHGGHGGPPPGSAEGGTAG